MDNTAVAGKATSSTLESLAQKVLLKALDGLSVGGLRLIYDGETRVFGSHQGPQAVIQVKSARFFREVLLSGSIGAGESYIDGHWDSPDLTEVVRLFAANLPLLERLEKRFAFASAISNRIKHLLSRNSLEGSKRNILAHYDLGNALYECFLDKSMLYSSAIYPDVNASLEAAQLHKLDTICQRLDLQPGMTLLEIGTGWGALAIHAARHYGVTVTTTTISDAQHDYAKKRIEDAGLSGSITLLKKDYRLLEGKFDRLVSIEMIEAVGHEYLPGFFSKLQSLLKDDGLLLIQAITIADQRYESYRKGCDFIQKYIFPGGCLPSVSRMANLISERTDLVISSLDDIGEDYARTLRHWHENVDRELPQIRALGYDERFIRLWKFYLSYCEGGFWERATSAVHLVAARPGWRSQTARS
ncbi:cyclopropane-fatty-acyl-phospholipid synthase family protein [Shewanella sp. JM162201]|uniref:Cyclopropane-fatty-acyl-phospholipid synthase family protein n=1 Tax=Shewanella jiangmenensis TaxID=2837387 RepID=A0ABS5V3D7_9GAMM|nr:cyclopropane-fatty-acyl-phospholipid synthase family protein [Shewanella jiangmenensis]MBT1444440.1 cyclopropane-fatty-acyl-phospholipid synthase family protein [Shewanella jiangmenensis]